MTSEAETAALEATRGHVDRVLKETAAGFMNLLGVQRKREPQARLDIYISGGWDEHVGRNAIDYQKKNGSGRGFDSVYFSHAQEAAIADAIAALHGRMTIVSISHGGWLLDRADHILRIEDGRLTVER